MLVSGVVPWKIPQDEILRLISHLSTISGVSSLTDRKWVTGTLGMLTFSSAVEPPYIISAHGHPEQLLVLANLTCTTYTQPGQWNININSVYNEPSLKEGLARPFPFSLVRRRQYRHRDWNLNRHLGLSFRVAEKKAWRILDSDEFKEASYQPKGRIKSVMLSVAWGRQEAPSQK